MYTVHFFAAGCLQSGLMLEISQRTFLVVQWQELSSSETQTVNIGS
jgi:hypothetical protein